MAANSSQCIPLNANISDLNDVNTSGASDKPLYGRTQWLPGTVSGGDGTVKSMVNVDPIPLPAILVWLPLPAR